MANTFNIEKELQKIVSMIEIVYATKEYTVNWEDILAELEEFASKGCAPCDTARFAADIVRMVQECADYMHDHLEQFHGFTSTGEAAEYLTLYALREVGLASTGENPAPFIDGESIGEPVPCSLWESLRMFLGAKFEFAHKADDFAVEYFMGPFVVSNDVVNDWLLFINHKQQGYVYVADLNRLVSIAKLVLNGDIETAASWMLADILDSVGTVVSRDHWAIGPIHIHCDDTDGWSWG